MQEALLNGDLTAFNKKGKQTMDSALGGDDKAMAAMLFFGSDRVGGKETILADLDKRTQELKEEREGAKDKEKPGIDKELARIREMKDQLGAGAGGGNKYLGVMQIVNADGEDAGELGVYQQ